MSGGFFRGTSADQDTRFSNKQAKLLKSQKFPPELDHLVDMTKVKMDVIRPWIATRATELLGFEDEVLINFVYGLLDVKVVDGKKIQIQLTGFMEKNTSKFMKELWTLLLSAQNNISGVPQQFLDAKEEEQRKMKVENDKISQEIQKRKDRAGRDLEIEKFARMEDQNDDSKSYKIGTDILAMPRDSNAQLKEERKVDEHHSLKTRSGEGHKARSPSVYSQSPRHSFSPRRRNHSPVRRSLTPLRKHKSPHWCPTSRSPIRSPHSRRRSPHSRRRSPLSRRRSPHSRRRSSSRSWNRFSSPYWHRSHARRSPSLHCRSPTPLRWRSPSPVRHRSPPLRRRSPSLVHCRSNSPARHRLLTPIQPQRTPSPFHHHSPIQCGFPSPARHESISPIRRSLLPLTSKYRRQSPPQSPVRRHAVSYNSPRQRNTSPSRHGSQSPLDRRDSRKVHNSFVNRVKSGRPNDERTERKLSVHHNLVKGLGSYVGSNKSPSHSKFQTGKMISLRILSSSRSPVEGRGGSISNHGGSETSREVDKTPCGRDVKYRKNDLLCKQSTYSQADMESSYAVDHIFDVVSPDRSAAIQFPTARHPVKSEIQRSDMGDREKGKAVYALQSPEDIEYGPGGTMGARNQFDNVKIFSGDRSPGGSDYMDHAKRGDVPNAISNLQFISKGTDNEESGCGAEHGNRSKKRFDKVLHWNSNYSDSDDTQDIDKQLKRSDSSRRDVNENSETDSQINDKKEAKRKRKEDKRLHKEDKRRRREERRRRRSERRAAKQKHRTIGASSPLDVEKYLNEAVESDESEDGAFQKKNFHRINVERINVETESEQKRLEIELRKKALESLRAKKAIND